MMTKVFTSLLIKMKAGKKNVEGVPRYQFDFSAIAYSLIAFIVIYEIVMVTYSAKIKKISIKEIMIE